MPRYSLRPTVGATSVAPVISASLGTGIAATAATMSASSGANDAAALAGACVTGVVVVADGVLVLEEPHPASAAPTTAMMVATAPVA
jgi:hypothetical protein